MTIYPHVHRLMTLPARVFMYFFSLSRLIEVSVIGSNVLVDAFAFERDSRRRIDRNALERKLRGRSTLTKTKFVLFPRLMDP